VLDDDELGALLRDEFQGLVSEVRPSPELLAKLPGETEAEVKRRSPHGWRVRHPRLWGMAVATAAAVTGVVVFTGGSSPAPAFAVTSGVDGSVTLTLSDLSGISGANARLAQLGVHARIVPMTTTCPDQVDVSYVGIDEHPAPTIHLVPSEIAPGTTILLAAKETGPNSVTMAIGRVTGLPPACVSSAGTGPGLAPSTTMPSNIQHSSHSQSH
jgi:hypothetical protein